MEIRYLLSLCITFFSIVASANFDATIPVLDLQDYYSQTKHQTFIEGLASAMQTVGFVALVNSKVDKNVLDQAYLAAEHFYARPLKQKMLGNDPTLHGARGYVLSETAKGRNVKDYKEYYHISREYPQELISKYGYKQNIWPDDVIFKESMQKLVTELDAYVFVICAALAESMGQPEDFLNEMTKHGDVLLRAIHYPANPPENTLWAAAHTDIDLFTILPRATAEGLQVLNAQGEWIDVVVPDGAFIINAGDMLQNLTNGVYKSAMHRVISKDTSKERYSVVLFIHPRPQDHVGPLPAYIAKVGKQNFAHATRDELLFERLIDLGLHTPALLEQFAASGIAERLIDVNRASPAALHALRAANLASPKVLAALSNLP